MLCRVRCHRARSVRIRRPIVKCRARFCAARPMWCDVAWYGPVWCGMGWVPAGYDAMCREFDAVRRRDAMRHLTRRVNFVTRCV